LEHRPADDRADQGDDLQSQGRQGPDALLGRGGGRARSGRPAFLPRLAQPPVQGVLRGRGAPVTGAGRMNCRVALGVLLGRAAGDRWAGPAERRELPYDRAIRKYLANQAAALERQVLPGGRTAAEFEKARPALRADFLDMLGLKPLPERTPLKAVVTGRLE